MNDGWRGPNQLVQGEDSSIAKVPLRPAGLDRIWRMPRSIIAASFVSVPALLLACGGDATYLVVVEGDGGTTSTLDAGADAEPCGENSFVCSGTCVDVANDPHHCGQCGTDCTTVAHAASASCSDGKCIISACNVDHADCDGLPGNGCEADLSTTTTCGSCQLSCDPDKLVCDSTGGATIGCVNPKPPRPIAPGSLTTSTSAQPTFRWEMPSNIPFVTLDLCADRACTTPIAAPIRVEESSYTMTTALPVGPVFWRVRSLDSTAAGATWELRIGHHDAPISTTWGNHLDMNEDGYSDFGACPDPGLSFPALIAVYAGGAAGIGTTALASMPNPIQLGAPTALAPAGDVDGDGYADLFDAAATTNGQGAANIVYGGPSGFDTSRTTDLFPPDGPGSDFGAAGRGVGDVDGDGYGDVLIGAPGAVMTAGRAYLYLGGPTGLSISPAATFAPSPKPAGVTERMGDAVAAAGDVNGDGFADFAVLANIEKVIRIYLGGRAPISETAAATISLPTIDNPVLASAGDVNGDGYGDLAVGIDDTVAVYLGGPAGLDTHSPISFQPSGVAYADHLAAGDFNGDGYTDVAIGFGDGGDGKVFVAYGSSTGIALVDAPMTPGDQIVVGDLDGDGYDDLFAAGLNGQLDVWRGSSTGLVTPASTPAAPKIRFPAEPGETMAAE